MFQYLNSIWIKDYQIDIIESEEWLIVYYQYLSVMEWSIAQLGMTEFSSAKSKHK